MTGSHADMSWQLKQAFDRHAGTYDDEFSRHPRAVELRGRTWKVLDALCSAPRRVIDLGCGTGEDAVHLASRGISVSAVDVSPEMLARVREKAVRAGVEQRVECHVADYTNIAGDRDTPCYQGIYSNFGALNCAPGLDWLQRLTGDLLEPGGFLVLVPMSRFYPLETALHLARGRVGPATRRWRSNRTAVVGETEFPVRYYGLGDLRRALGPRFVLEHSEALHLLLPVPAFDHVDTRFEWAFSRCRGVDLWLSRRRLFRGWGDHFISVWRYRGKA